MSHIQISLTSSFWRGMTRLTTISPPALASRRVLSVVLHPTGHCVQIEACALSSHGRAPKRKSAWSARRRDRCRWCCPRKQNQTRGRRRKRSACCVRVRRSQGPIRPPLHPESGYSARTGCSVRGRARSTHRAAHAFRDAFFHHRGSGSCLDQTPWSDFAADIRRLCRRRDNRADAR